MYSSMLLRTCVRSNITINRNFGIVTSVHLFNTNNNTNNHHKTTNYEVGCKFSKCSVLLAQNTLTSSVAKPATNDLISSNTNIIKRQYSKSHKPKHIEIDIYLESDSSSSDSDREKKQKKINKRGSSDFWRRKMRTLHSLLDVNHDGVISFDDFQLLAQNFTALGHLTPEAQQEFLTVLKTIWEAQWGEISPYNLVNAEQYLTQMQHTINDKELCSKVHTFLPYLFKAVDKDHSGFISLHEFKLFFKCLGLTPEDAAVSFAIIDKNGDGKLSLKEFVKLGREYFLTENEKKASRMFWGPLCPDH